MTLTCAVLAGYSGQGKIAAGVRGTMEEAVRGPATVFLGCEILNFLPFMCVFPVSWDKGDTGWHDGWFFLVVWVSGITRTCVGQEV